MINYCKMLLLVLFGWSMGPCFAQTAISAILSPSAISA
jgi:hypothetical protein